MPIFSRVKNISNEAVLRGLGIIGRTVPLTGVPVLHYHSVLGEDQSCVTEGSFREQMRCLHEQGVSVWSLNRLIEYLKGEMDVPRKVIVLTFDDGYKTNYDFAFPILKNFNFTATIFLATGRIGKTADWDKKSRAYGVPLMSWENVKEMSAYGIDFGAHTDTHPYLTQIPLKRVREEMAVSKAKLEDILGKPVRSFAYPYGDYNARVKEIAQECHFACACTTEPGLNARGQDLFAVRRSGVFRNTSSAGFHTRINGTFRWYFNAKKWMKSVSR